MEHKKNTQKVDFLKITEEEQKKILKEALYKGQEEQRKLERQYDELLAQGVTC
jgi:predicted transcriptional regulator